MAKECDIAWATGTMIISNSSGGFMTNRPAARIQPSTVPATRASRPLQCLRQAAAQYHDDSQQNPVTMGCHGKARERAITGADRQSSAQGMAQRRCIPAPQQQERPPRPRSGADKQLPRPCVPEARSGSASPRASRFSLTISSLILPTRLINRAAEAHTGGKSVPGCV